MGHKGTSQQQNICKVILDHLKLGDDYVLGTQEH